MLEQALTYLSYGLQALPAIPKEKRPWGNWRDLQQDLLTPNQLTERCRDETYKRQYGELTHIGILTGQVSGGLEVIDVDCKYDLTGTLYLDLKGLIDDNLPDLANRFVIDRTPSKGYHIYYRTNVVEGNKKLARRPTTTEERAKDTNDKMKVLVETRGEGGFIVVPPTAGYELIQGDFADLPHLTDEERKILFSIARSFNEEPEPEQQARTDQQRHQSGNDQPTGGISPFADYNQRGDVVSMLVHEFGWTEVNRQGQRTNLKRPGQSDTKTSGNFHEGLRKLYVFSSSTEFEPEKAYSPADVFILLKCNGDKKEAARQLLSMGYGERGTYQKAGSRVETSSIHVEANDANGVPTDLTSEGYLTSERIKETPMDAAYIYYTGYQSTAEVVRALDLLEKTSPVKVYLVEVADLSDKSNRIKTLRAYEFRAADIIARYERLYDEAEQASRQPEPEDQDRLIDDFVKVGVKLSDPIERGRFKSLFMDFVEASGLGIPEEAYRQAEEKLRYNEQKEKQREAINTLLSEAADLTGKGELEKVLDRLKERGQEIRSIATADSFRVLNTPITEANIADQLKSKPDDIQTGYYLGYLGPPPANESPEDKAEREIRLPAGAVSIIAGATSHGKTAFLLNFAINAARVPFGKNIYVLGYEESAADMTVRAMNAYINMDFSKNNRRTIASHYKGSNAYFKDNTYTDFNARKTEFFTDLIEGGRLSIQSVDYDSDVLMEAIRYLHSLGNTGGVFIDYMQLLRKPVWKNTRQEELKQICMDLKDVARETGLPIVLAAQFNRSVKNAAQMHPTNISEAGDIERVANVILGLWNNDKRSRASEEETAELNTERNYRGTPGMVYVDLLKNRGGRPQLDGMLNFNGNTGVLSNSEKTWSVPSDSNPFASKKNR